MFRALKCEGLGFRVSVYLRVTGSSSIDSSSDQ